MYIARDRVGRHTLIQKLLGDIEVEVATTVADIEKDAIRDRFQNLRIDSAIPVEHTPLSPHGMRDHITRAQKVEDAGQRGRLPSYVHHDRDATS
jgi:hypothetical protein